MREDKRTRSDYIREIERLERLNNHFEKSHKELIEFIEDEIEDVDYKIKKGYEFLEDSKGYYTLRMNLQYYKNALVKVSKKIFELERC